MTANVGSSREESNTPSEVVVIVPPVVDDLPDVTDAEVLADSPLPLLKVPLNHPRFLEWIGVPEPASLLEMGPGRWLNALWRDQAMAAAIQLQRDVCPMTTNLNILDQYALSLQGTASEMMEMGLGSSDFPSADVAAGALGPRVAALPYRWRLWGCAWRPSLDPIF